jgi:hypothetical protein
MKATLIDLTRSTSHNLECRSRTAHTKFAGASVAGADNDELLHVTTALESDYDMSQWHIPRISHKSSCKCHTQQAATNVKYTDRIAKGSKGTPAPTYRGSVSHQVYTWCSKGING